ncbi:hypothetical protein [Novosphingobium sp. EMRT-2]|uniref:hypothetical protein n=1 Tax=Novosphingobium sp. EMRT-2 TaxID=2571749 RepID=UPI0010BCFD84|nr:hypothetical protein [Novosphingobium sp. EMRT-2]QCI92577.1 hypothetical protein FA702_02750 [Novosphingobium sp. EMRT-2]
MSPNTSISLIRDEGWAFPIPFFNNANEISSESHSRGNRNALDQREDFAKRNLQAGSTRYLMHDPQKIIGQNISKNRKSGNRSHRFSDLDGHFLM